MEIVQYRPIGRIITAHETQVGTPIQPAAAKDTNGTPLLDIKPYVPAFDRKWFVRTGWLKGKGRRVRTARADERFG